MYARLAAVAALLLIAGARATDFMALVSGGTGATPESMSADIEAAGLAFVRAEHSPRHGVSLWVLRGTPAAWQQFSESARAAGVELSAVSSSGAHPIRTRSATTTASSVAGNWGLDRIDQRKLLPLDGYYSPYGGATGSGVDVFLVDSGISPNPDLSNFVLEYTVYPYEISSAFLCFFF